MNLLYHRCTEDSCLGAGQDCGKDCGCACHLPTGWEYGVDVAVGAERTVFCRHTLPTSPTSPTSPPRTWTWTVPDPNGRPSTCRPGLEMQTVEWVRRALTWTLLVGIVAAGVAGLVMWLGQAGGDVVR